MAIEVQPSMYLENETYARITTLLREVGDNNQIWTTSYPSRTIDSAVMKSFRIEDYLGN